MGPPGSFGLAAVLDTRGHRARRNKLRVAEDARLLEALSFTLLIKIHEHTLPRHALAWTRSLIFLLHRLNLRCCHTAGYAFLARLERRAASDVDGL